MNIHLWAFVCQICDCQSVYDSALPRTNFSLYFSNMKFLASLSMYALLSFFYGEVNPLHTPHPNYGSNNLLDAAASFEQNALC